jgi:NADH-quinone oxidoreductase subunit J
MTEILFFVFAAAALGGALGVILSRNPVHSALWLVLTLLSVAVFFLLQDAELVAAVQVIVYAGAIVVLFLFVIMLLGVDKEESLSDPVKLQRPAAIALGALVLAEVVFLAGHEWATGAKTGHGIPITGPDAGGRPLGNNIARVAHLLFTDFMWPFQITAGLLVVAVVGAIVLARRSGERPEGQEAGTPPPERAGPESRSGERPDDAEGEPTTEETNA